MPDAYTYISKPTDATYTNTNVQGRQVYDESSLTYDDASAFYNSVDMSAYSNVSKPSDGKYIIAGMATGLITPPTYARSYDASPWTKISKPLT